MPGSRVDQRCVPRSPEETYDAAVRRGLPAVVAGLGLLLAAMAALHGVLLDGTARLVTVPLAATSSLVLGVLWLLLRHRQVPDRLAHPVTAAAVLLVVADAVTRVGTTGEPRQTTDLMLVVVGAGAALLSLRWLLGVLYVVWGAWVVVAFTLLGPRPQWIHYTVGMVTATGLALALNAVRRTTVRQLAEARAEAEAAAVRDHLTGLANRRGLALVGSQILEQARRQGDAAHCIFVDVDHLKAVNESYGHETGDGVLVAVAEALRLVTRATDVVARWGGDEFCVVGPGPGMAPLELERRVHDHLVHHPAVLETQWSPHVSAGGAMLAPWDSGTLDTLLGKADQEMYIRQGLRREGPSPSPRPATAD